MSSEEYPDLADSDSPRGKSKVLKPKSIASKEIESWAKSKTDRRIDFARQSGQLSDNVTEQRMLQSKIMELSKERYKFMSQNAYERKVFLDRQQRKTNVMKDLLKGIDVDKYIRRAGVLCSDMDQSLAPRKPKKLGGRLGLLDRLDPTQKPKASSDDNGKEEQQHIRPHTTMPSIKEKHASFRNGGKVLPKTANASVNRRSNSRVNFSSKVEALPDLTWNRKDSRGTPMSDRRDSLLSNASEDEDVGSGLSNRRQFKRANTFTSLRSSKSGDYQRHSSSSRSLSYPNNAKYKSVGPTTDPRYYLLTKSLCDNYTPCMEIPAEEVDGVIKKIDTLHTPARRVREMQGRPKMNRKLQDFMRERGMVFQ
ncbi:uncharacterized protein LOC135489031 [Lineus longissimus]|uniref:uncharacterized protein LOC135489031 n=1 Tax=Lineus longissimus TaxID=88925 RepID=UPI00315C9D99